MDIELNFDKELAQIIDHTILRPGTTLKQVKTICDQAIKYDFAAVCVPPCYVDEAFEWLKIPEINITTVIGFPMGFETLPAKLAETANAISNGCTEIDACVNIGMMKEGRWDYIESEIKDLTELVQRKGRILKIIIEAGLLDEAEITKACALCAKYKVMYVKTSTGFVEQGATPEMVAHMREILPKHVRIKASGGIRTREEALAIIAAGADRIGTSSSLAIIGVA